MVSGAIGGFTILSSMSNAENATFINNSGVVSGAGSGSTLIQTAGNIGSSTFIGNAATVTGAEGGWVEIDSGTASGAKFIAMAPLLPGRRAAKSMFMAVMAMRPSEGKVVVGTAPKAG